MNEQQFLRKLKQAVKDFDEIIKQPEWKTFASTKFLGDRTFGDLIITLHLKDLNTMCEIFKLYKTGNLTVTWKTPKEPK